MIFYDPIYIYLDQGDKEPELILPPSSDQDLPATEPNAQRSADLSSGFLPLIQDQPSPELQSHPIESSDVLPATTSNDESFLALQTTAAPPSSIQPQIPCESDPQLSSPTSPPESPLAVSGSQKVAESDQQTSGAEFSSLPDQSALEPLADIPKPQPSDPIPLATVQPESLADYQTSTSQLSSAPELPPAPEPPIVESLSSVAITQRHASLDQGIPILPNGHNSTSHINPTSPPTPPPEPTIVSPPSLATMAANIPAKLKSADLTRFIVRAGQLETAKPVVAYWCEYWIVNQILTRKLHEGDNDTMTYTMTLMDKLEQVKAQNADNDAIIDDTAGQAYVENFAMETFQRAERTVQANKVTKQTADTFQAAATFLELVNIWNPPDAETQSKIKYAKWNAVRIVKALKEGKDPNDSNPKQPEAEENLPQLDPNDPEVKNLGGPTKPRQASVVEVPDEQDLVEKRLARQSSIDQSLHPSAQVSARGSPAPPFDPYPRDGFPYTAVQDDNVSPLEPSTPNERNGSVGGGYFPEVPTFEAGTPDIPHPTAPPTDILNLGLPDQPSFNPSAKAPEDFQSFPPPVLDDPPTAAPQDFYAQAPPPSAPVHPHPQQPPVQPHAQYPPPVQPPQHFQPPPQQYQQPPPQHFAPPPAQASQPIRKDQLNTDDVAIAKAQKHARWAISALNFEDAETAVRELRDALRTLGAS